MKVLKAVKILTMRWAVVGLPMLLVVMAAIGCSRPKDPFPRPKGWPRIDLPAHTYQSFDNGICPFNFEYPATGRIEKQKADSCWMDLYFPEFECRWHVTYRLVPGSGKTISDHQEEYRKLVFKHIQKVSQIKETPIEGANGSGILYELFGTVGVPAQIVYTDSTHLVMASFYFDTAVRNDSLAPVIDFMKQDLRHLAESIVWK
jgi:gliding motility-associated lipoprotein GldD